MRLPVLLLFPFIAMADTDVRDADAQMFPGSVSYRADVPTPRDFLGFELGAEPVRHHQLVDYLRLLAGMSDRLSIETIGYSHERRPILFIVATSPENHARLDDIRARHVALSEPGSGQSVTGDMPVVTWLNYGVHGAESSGMDAALPLVYHLAAAEGDAIESVLDESVVLVTAIFNPDGHAKRISWFDAFGGVRRIADPAHVEHQFSWQFARTNHYWFDLNRQWLLLTQPEAVAWMRKWHEWRPNLTVDYHEMGSAQTYYFHPGERSRTNPLVPDEAEALMQSTAAFSEAVLDAEARLYYQGERFDNYYVGKGSTFPLVNGGVGMLYEAGAALGREIETDSGLRTYRENIRKQFLTSLAMLDAAVTQRADFLRYQKAFYERALDSGRAADTQAWIVTAGGDRVRLKAFKDLLESHRIDVFAPTRDVEADGVSFERDQSLVIPTAQPQYTLIRSVFETVDTFEDATFYDVSTWTLPPAFGLQYAALGGRESRGIRGDAAMIEPDAARPGRASYGYMIDWSDYYAPKALYRLLEDGVLARVAMEPSVLQTDEGRSEFARGSIFVPLDRQPAGAERVHALVDDIASIDGLRVHAVDSGRSVISTRGVNPGGPSFDPLAKPSILMLIGDPISYYDAGEIWHLLDYRMNIPVTLRDMRTLAGIDWSRYTHILMPSGTYDSIPVEVLDRMRLWINEGGTAVAFKDAAAWLRSQTLDYTPPVDGVTPVEETEEEEALEGRFDFASKDDREAVDVLGGAIFQADLDVTHPLGFGYMRREISLHKNYREPFEPTNNPYASVIQYTEAPLLSGYASADNVEAIAATPALIAERVERGSVILFADNPNFRGYWYGTNKLFLNTLFFSTAFSAPEE